MMGDARSSSTSAETATTPETLRRALSLLVLTDRACARGRDVVELVRAAVAGGATSVQLRDKEASAREMVQTARALLPHLRAAGVPLFVNDRVDVALIAGADGAHVGDDDVPLTAARRIVPPGFLLGRSVDDVSDALRAEAEGADYLGVGPVFATATKTDAGPVVGIDGVRSVVDAVTIPVVGIGGIDADGAGEVVRAGADGVAVVSAVFGADDVRGAAERVRQTVEAARRG
jgi:thiamine-phosphate pyrophosphorylase